MRGRPPCVPFILTPPLSTLSLYVLNTKVPHASHTSILTTAITTHRPNLDKQTTSQHVCCPLLYYYFYVSPLFFTKDKSCQHTPAKTLQLCVVYVIFSLSPPSSLALLPASPRLTGRKEFAYSPPNIRPLTLPIICAHLFLNSFI